MKKVATLFALVLFVTFSGGCSLSTSTADPFVERDVIGVGRQVSLGGSVYFTALELQPTVDGITVTDVEMVDVVDGSIGLVGFATWNGSSGAPSMVDDWPSAGWQRLDDPDLKNLSQDDSIFAVVELTLPEDSEKRGAVASGVEVMFEDSNGRAGVQLFAYTFIVCLDPAVQCLPDDDG